MIYPSNNFYEGVWSADKKDGYGIMNWLTINEKVINLIKILKIIFYL